jgi:hypothetical protein
VHPSAKQWMHFNLYDGGLGKKPKFPKFQDIVNSAFIGNMEDIEKYILEEKKYTKVE